VIVQQPVAKHSTPVFSPTEVMKPEAALAVNPDPLFFVFYAVDSAVGAPHYYAYPCYFVRIFGWLV
jgi:hypothetical protein